ncbi:MAG: NTP transferase domain-containing protein [Candidatus Omnitrophica bacterium]|nr:UTP--glucose-1-phosphate uridylyltransferase [bacterium]NUN95454.1 NTP transferase domain-containing protein [Candidatus Omnitrophota bacterium]
MQAVILAGGKGSRLQPYTTVLPKPLMPVGDMPILEIILRQLAKAGCRTVFLTVGRALPLFRAVFAEGERLGLKIRYALEEEPLGTAGPIASLVDDLEEDFLVMNGDLLTTLDYRRFFEFHREQGCAATLAAHERSSLIDFGVLEPDSEGRLVNYIEKPTYTFTVSMGVYAMRKSLVAPHLGIGERLDFPDLIRRLLDSGTVVRCHHPDCFWLDIGRLDDFQTAQEVFEKRRAEFLP